MHAISDICCSKTSLLSVSPSNYITSFIKSKPCYKTCICILKVLYYKVSNSKSDSIQKTARSLLSIQSMQGFRDQGYKKRSTSDKSHSTRKYKYVCMQGRTGVKCTETKLMQFNSLKQAQFDIGYIQELNTKGLQGNYLKLRIAHIPSHIIVALIILCEKCVTHLCFKAYYLHYNTKQVFQQEAI